MKRFWNDLTGHFRYAIYAAQSELKAEVASSYLNWIWWVLEPFCFMLIYTFVFGYAFGMREQYFPVFIFVGLTAWDFFQRNINQSVKILKSNRAIVTKVYMPKFVLLISRMMFNGYKMLISFGIVVAMLIYYQVPVSWKLIYVIPILIVMFVFTFGFMLFLMHYGVYVRDLVNVTTIVLRMMFYMTGIFYNIETKLPPKFVGPLLHFNPMALILSSLRNCILHNATPDFKWLGIWFVIGLIVSVLGVRKVYKNENSYVKVI
jgi:ABC-type polysaccharide/polyol phosphate export permease